MIEGIHRRREPRLGVALCLGVTCLTWGCGGATHDASARMAPRKAGETIEPRADRAPDDASIASALRARLARDGAIDVEVQNGAVTMRGTVDHLLARRHAAEVAAHTRGVVSVDDRLEVRPVERTDDEIQRDLARALALRPIATHPIDAQVAGGHALLKGRVSSLAEQRAAEEITAGIRGVRAVTCALEVVPAEPRTDDAIRGDVAARLRSDVRVDPQGLDVQVADGRVVLTGIVASEAERQLAARIASVHGARAVDASGVRVQWSRDELRRTSSLPGEDAIAVVLRDAIAQELGAPREPVRVRISEGIATLEGTVESVAAERAVLELATHTVGVSQVDDRLTVIPDPLIADEALEERVAELLGMSPYASSAPIDIRVERGVVTLMGDVGSRVARSEAERVAMQLAGVRGLDNRLELDARSVSADRVITADIQRQLASCPYLGPMDLRVSVRDGVATLRGRVDDVRAYREAELEALDAGAIAVVNEVRVQASGAPRATLARR